MARLLFFLIVGYAVMVALVYFFQRSLQYFPDRNPIGTPEASGVPGMQVVKIRTEDAVDLVGWFTPPEKEKGPVVILFHGNAGHLAHRAFKARYFIEKGIGVYLVGYRGYGGNKGTPSEVGLYEDARAVLRWLEKEGYSASQFVIYGESIGTGVAVEMAREFHPKALILEGPFSSALDVAKIAYPYLPVDVLMKDRFSSLAKIPHVKAPLLIVHGDEDMVIPIGLAKKLYEAANHPKEFVTINGGGHNDLYDHHAGHVIVEWLEKLP